MVHSLCEVCARSAEAAAWQTARHAKLRDLLHNKYFMPADMLKAEHAWDAITYLMQLLRSYQDMRHSSWMCQVLTCQPVTSIVCICCTCILANRQATRILRS